MDILDFSIGMSFILEKKISLNDVSNYAKITGDNNPIHLNAVYAAETMFKRPVVHGLLVASIFSQIFGTKFPGNGCVYLEQNVKFIKPVYMDELIVAKVLITELDKEKKLLHFSTDCEVNNIKVIVGNAKIYIP
ncbi:MaoC family dehydratase [Shewanella frigidimarina]|jgi:3-hydroxybutyryl-CoA dehydratase|uniref:MaoC family dehydratase n=1 Tax=Shewanella frigidimarina TaxID=56812 RepID=UPI003D7AF129